VSLENRVGAKSDTITVIYAFVFGRVAVVAGVARLSEDAAIVQQGGRAISAATIAISLTISDVEATVVVGAIGALTSANSRTVHAGLDHLRAAVRIADARIVRALKEVACV
jgi:hypothetical protein